MHITVFSAQSSEQPFLLAAASAGPAAATKSTCPRPSAWVCAWPTCPHRFLYVIAEYAPAPMMALMLALNCHLHQANAQVRRADS